MHCNPVQPLPTYLFQCYIVNVPDTLCRHETFVDMVRRHLQGDKPTANGRSPSSASLSSLSSQRSQSGGLRPANMPVYGTRDRL